VGDNGGSGGGGGGESPRKSVMEVQNRALRSRKSTGEGEGKKVGNYKCGGTNKKNTTKEGCVNKREKKEVDPFTEMERKKGCGPGITRHDGEFKKK